MVAESAARGALGTALLADRPGAPPHIGVLLPNVAEFVFWLGGAALAGVTVVKLVASTKGTCRTSSTALVTKAVVRG